MNNKLSLNFQEFFTKKLDYILKTVNKTNS